MQDKKGNVKYNTNALKKGLSLPSFLDVKALCVF